MSVAAKNSISQQKSLCKQVDAAETAAESTVMLFNYVFQPTLSTSMPLSSAACKKA